MCSTVDASSNARYCYRDSIRLQGVLTDQQVWFPVDFQETFSRKFSRICSFIDIYRAGSLTPGITPEMDMGWVNPWVGLGWVRMFQFVMGWVGSSYENWRFLFTCYWCIYYNNILYLFPEIQNKRKEGTTTQLGEWLDSCGRSRSIRRVAWRYTYIHLRHWKRHQSAVLQQKRAGHLQGYESASFLTGRPLNFWREQSSDYQFLSQVACRELAISSSYAQFERDFRHRPKNKIVGEQSGSCRTFTLGLRAGMQAHV